jgi:hypothetical protein
MNYTTNFKTIRDEVSPDEWQARLDLAACYRLIDAYGMTDLIYNHITARIPGSDDHRDPQCDPPGPPRGQMRPAYPHPRGHGGRGDGLRAAADFADVDPLFWPCRLSRL